MRPRAAGRGAGEGGQHSTASSVNGRRPAESGLPVPEERAQLTHRADGLFVWTEPPVCTGFSKTFSGHAPPSSGGGGPRGAPRKPLLPGTHIPEWSQGLLARPFGSPFLLFTFLN